MSRSEILRLAVTRHARPARSATPEDPVSTIFPSLTKFGLEQAADRARTDIHKWISQSPVNAVTFLSGVSDLPRTRDTLQIYTDALLTEPKMSVIQLQNQTRASALQLCEETTQNDKRTVCAIPQRIKQWHMTNRWYDSSGKPTAYASALLAKHNGDFGAATQEWIGSDHDRTEGVPNPHEIAEAYLLGIVRLHCAAKRLTTKSVQILGVGHQMDLDVFMTLLTNGRVDLAGFMESSGNGQTFGESEIFTAEWDLHSGSLSSTYRQRSFAIDLDPHSLPQIAKYLA